MSEEKIRRMLFKMERPGQVKIGDYVTITEKMLPYAYYYTVEPAVAMSGNIEFCDRLLAKEGTVINIEENPKGYYVTVEFKETSC